MSVLSHLEPQPIWRHFAKICAIPHPSHHEEALRAHIHDWAVSRGIEAVIDPVGNLLLRKAASPGHAQAPVTLLQAHLDMVPQKNTATAHDFLRDPIMPRVVDGWVKATDTTLGADNGIGVAAALAVLEDASLVHGPLEVLLTINEERGMEGALGLAPDLLKAELMLNLDTEEWGEFYLGCAGGMDINIAADYPPESLPEGWVVRQIVMTGLRGGHSGCDIHRGRGSANKLMVRLLQRLLRTVEVRLGRFDGGTLRNAIAREAVATLAMPPEQSAHVEALLDQAREDFARELQGVDDGLEIRLQPAQLESLLPEAVQQQWLAALDSCAHGVLRMSQQVPGVVETSNNLATIAIADGHIAVEMMPRSLIDSAGRDHGESLCGLFRLIGARAEIAAPYPGWRPEPESALLALSQRVYRREFGCEPELKVIHAGLECGILGSHYPKMQMLSLGPTIIGAHSPDEAVEIASIAPFWQLLRALLQEIALQPAV